MISISTTAVGNVVLAEIAPANQHTLMSIAFFSLIASFSWLVLSERVVSIKFAIERIAASLPEGDLWSRHQQAMEAVRQDNARGVFAIAVLSVISSVLWLFPML